MTSGGNNFSYFLEHQLIKFSAVLQFKHSEMSCFVGLQCCFAGQYRLHIEGNYSTQMEVHGSAQEELSCHNQCLSMIFSAVCLIVHALGIFRPSVASVLIN